MNMIQTIITAIKTDRDFHTVVEDFRKETQKTCELVKANGYALDKINIKK